MTIPDVHGTAEPSSADESGTTPAAPRSDAPDRLAARWVEFSTRLAGGVTLLEPGAAVDFHAPSPRDPQGCRVTVHADVDVHERLWVTSGTRGPDTPERLVMVGTREEAPELADTVTTLFRLTLGLASPDLVVARPRGDGADLLLMAVGLETEDVHEPSASEYAAGIGTPDIETIHSVADSVTREYVHKGCFESVIDSDGDVAITLDGWPPIFVMPNPVLSLIRIQTAAVWGVYSRRSTAVELAILNNGCPFVRWELVDRTVLLQATVQTAPYQRSHLERALREFFTQLNLHRSDLAFRLGASCP